MSLKRLGDPSAGIMAGFSLIPSRSVKSVNSTSVVNESWKWMSEEDDPPTCQIGKIEDDASEDLDRTHRSRTSVGTTNSLLMSLATDLTKFSDQEWSLLRGIGLDQIMSRGARVLQNSKGIQSNYELSQPVDKIDLFVSHNWSVSRRRKFMCLALHFNMKGAIIAAALAAVAGFCLNVAGVMNIPADSDFFEDDFDVGMCIEFICAPTFICALFLKHDACGSSRGRIQCFLDKTCIHQTDTSLKQRGIEKLGAFLSNSSRFLILYTDVYMCRLWTIYEVACFFGQRVSSMDQLQVLHVGMAHHFFVLVLYLYSMMVFQLAAPFLGLPSFWVYMFTWLLMAFVVAKVDRHGRQTLRAVWMRLEEFCLEDATCAKEDDRPVIERNIQAIMVMYGYVDQQASRQDALSAFNKLIRTDILRLMKASVGTTPISYSQIVIVLCLTNFATHLDIVSGMLKFYGASSLNTWLHLVHYISVNVVVLPMCVQVLLFISSGYTTLCGVPDAAWSLFAAVCSNACGVVFGISIPKHILLARAESSTLFLCLFFFYNLTFAGAALLLRRRRHLQRRSQLEQCSIFLDSKRGSKCSKNSKNCSEQESVVREADSLDAEHAERLHLDSDWELSSPVSSSVASSSCNSPSLPRKFSL